MLHHWGCWHHYSLIWSSVDLTAADVKDHPVFYLRTSHEAPGWREINRENKPALALRRAHRRPCLKEISEIVGTRNDSSDRGPSLFSATCIFTRSQGGLKMQSSGNYWWDASSASPRRDEATSPSVCSSVPRQFSVSFSFSFFFFSSAAKLEFHCWAQNVLGFFCHLCSNANLLN